MWKEIDKLMKSGRLTKVARLITPNERTVARRKGKQTKTRK